MRGIASLTSLFLLAASFHLGARDVASLVKKIEVTLFPLDTALCYFLGVASLFGAPRHLGAGYIASLVNVVKVTLLPLDT